MSHTAPWTDPWFWAFLAAMGWALALGLIGTRRPGRRLAFGVTCFVLVEAPRLVLVLPFVAQPRFDADAWPGLAGVFLLVAGLVFAAPVLRITPLTAPDRGEPLRTDGLYAWVRHPLMVCEVLWPLGVALLFGSWIGVLLTPVWVAILVLLTQVEEEALVREYGDAYRRYQARVRRLLPRPPGLRAAPGMRS